MASQYHKKDIRFMCITEGVDRVDIHGERGSGERTRGSRERRRMREQANERNTREGRKEKTLLLFEECWDMFISEVKYNFYHLHHNIYLNVFAMI